MKFILFLSCFTRVSFLNIPSSVDAWACQINSCLHRDYHSVTENTRSTITGRIIRLWHDGISMSLCIHNETMPFFHIYLWLTLSDFIIHVHCLNGRRSHVVMLTLRSCCSYQNHWRIFMVGIKKPDLIKILIEH